MRPKEKRGLDQNMDLDLNKIISACFCVSQNIQAEKEALTDGREKKPKYHRTEDGFIRIGEPSVPVLLQF